VSPDAILRDGGGLRTLDSILRGRDVFRKDRFVVVSQRFHVERAVYLARANGIDAYGYVAADADGLVHVSVRLREYAARVKALLDVYLFGSH
jgi:SanA protein